VIILITQLSSSDYPITRCPDVKVIKVLFWKRETGNEKRETVLCRADDQSLPRAQSRGPTANDCL
jgi:hypothetical protein